jgi:hypothetical protein
MRAADGPAFDAYSKDNCRERLLEIYHSSKQVAAGLSGCLLDIPEASQLMYGEN